MTGTEVNSTESGYIEGEFKHWDRDTQAHILGSYFYGLIFTQVLGGYIADKFGTKRILLNCMLVKSLLELLIPFLSE